MPRISDPLEALRVVLPAEAFSDAELRELVPLCEVQRVPAGTAVITEGTPSDNRVLFLLEGSVAVSIQGRFILRLQTRGETLGEMGLISSAPRSATVTTETPTTFLVVHGMLSAVPGGDADYRLRYYLSRLFNSILADKLRRTSDRARLYEDIVSQSRAMQREQHDLQEQIDRYLREISLYTHLVNSARDAIVVADTDGRVLNANPALGQAFAVARTVTTGTALTALIADADGGPWDWPGVAAAARRGGWHGEVAVRAGDDPPVPADCSVSVVNDPGGGLLAYSVMLRDIRVRKAHEAEIRRQGHELERAHADLQALERAKNSFLTLVSHHLRTPITAIQAYAETLSLEGMVEPHEQGEFIDIIHQEAGKLGDMVNKVLAISKMESGQMFFQFQSNELEHIVRERVAMLRSGAEARGLRLEVDVPAPVEAVVCDAGQIGEAVHQLLDNAIRHSDTDRVSVRLEQTEGESLIRVCDAGKGIQGSATETLLQKFSRGDVADPGSHGLGLGLPLSALILQAHGGALRVESNPGQGTTVSLVLPRFPSPDQGVA